MMITIGLLSILAYLLGSIPSSVWLGKMIRGIDLREHGSGNAGTSNAFRVLGWKIGIAVLVLDIAKGFLAVNLSHLQNDLAEGSEGWMIFRITLGILAVAGHIFPVFAGFRGGKGVATFAGIGLAIHPLATLAALGVYLIIFLIFRVSSLGSLAAALSYPLWVMVIFNTGYKSLALFSAAVTAVILLTHISNIKRLFRGEEKLMNRRRKDS